MEPRKPKEDKDKLPPEDEYSSSEDEKTDKEMKKTWSKFQPIDSPTQGKKRPEAPDPDSPKNRQGTPRPPGVKR